MKKATINDVAQLAGVSKSTVSAYINKKYHFMSGVTKVKIQNSIDELNYRPNELARSLKQKKTSIIGVIVASIGSEFTTEIVRAIESVCQEKDIQMIFCNTDDDENKERAYLNQLIARQLDGLIVIPTTKNIEMFKILISQDYPIVFVGRKINGLDIPAVLFDNIEASKLAVEEFAKKGHRQIALLTGSLSKYTLTSRVELLEGYRDALKKYEIEIDERFIYHDSHTGVKESLKKMFDLEKPPTAILAENDLIMQEVLMFAKEKERTIPNNFSLVGIGDPVFAKLHTPPISTIVQPTYEMGKQAAALLFEKIEGKAEMAITYRFPPKFTFRASVAEKK